MSPELEFAEEWLPALGWEGYYEVSSLGRVRSLSRLTRYRGRWKSGKILRLKLDDWGYLRARFCVDMKQRQVRVAGLVAHAFIGPRPPGKTIDHKDGNKLNNAASNLEYVSNKENTRRAIALGNFSFPPRRSGEQHSQAKLTDSEVAEIRRLQIEGMKHREIAELFNISRTQVTKIINKQRRRN
jgi:hypothetical protein